MHLLSVVRNVASTMMLLQLLIDESTGRDWDSVEREETQVKILEKLETLCASPLINVVLYALWHPPKNNTHGLGLMFLEVANCFIN